MKHLD